MTLRTDAPLVVVGDALLDVDLVGRADRLAPDAPVPVVQVERESARPGGAGLAAILGRRLGRRPVVLVTPVAEDAEGGQLSALLADAGVSVVPIPHPGRTTVKQRVLARDRSVLRVDQGEPVESSAVDRLPDDAAAALREAAAVLVSDYGVGSTALEAVRRAVARAGGPVVWDPHPRGTAPVPGVTLATPNEAEVLALSEGLGSTIRAGSTSRTFDISARAALLAEQWRARGVAVTLGARGALLSRGDAPPTLVPPPRLPIDGQDTCGAGDCFAVAAALSLAAGAVLPEAVQDAVAAATRFVYDGGAAAVGSGEPDAPARPRGEPGSMRAAVALAEQVRATGGTVVATGGCFDLLHAGHVDTLEAARSLGDCLIVLLNADDSVRRLKGPGRPIVPEQDRARVLAALDAVDAVALFHEDTPIEALRRLRPDVWAKGGDYSLAQLPEAEVLAEWGAQTVVLPYLDGRSTTRLVEYAGGRSG